MNWFKNAKKWKNKIPGGNADKKVPSDFPKEDVEKGHLVEFEHTNNPDIAKEITMDHLEEHPDYYSGLKHMENLLTELEKREENRNKDRRENK